MSLWRPFPPGAQALVPLGFIVTRCEHCGRGTVDAADGLDGCALRGDNLAVHELLHRGRLVEPVTGKPSERDLILNVARALNTAASGAANPVARVRGVRQARSLRWPWFAWVWELLPE